ncbi:unnamed protein product [Lactuca saligna]|uniref:Cyclic nucleotide-binding domain-containing protein n=1 Tax=Lactuca saligna TaxID=75948 RepID=A0AA35V4N8_LACSI|nr:unnamed protein product [Lactuca saligna]
MDAGGEDDVHNKYRRKRKFSNRNNSVSISIPVISNELNSGENDGVVHRWTREKLSFLKHFTIRVMKPDEKAVELLNQFVLVSCILAIFIDPLFFYLLSMKKDFKCVVIDWTLAITLVVSRSITDLIYFLRMLVEFRLAYISSDPVVVGAGDLVQSPREIRPRYISGFFLLDLFIILPVPQIVVLFIQPNGVTSPGIISNAKFILQTAFIIQYIPRLYRFQPLLAGQSPSGFIFESTWANFFINLMTFVLASHFIGSCWYMLTIMRMNRCLRDVCNNSTITDCRKFIDCGRGNDYGGFERNLEWNDWKQDRNSSVCFREDGINYGIYATAVNLTTDKSFLTRYVYSFFWGLQQISTLAGNQTPSYIVGEVLFTMGIIGLGLLLFALLIGNMQNFLLGLGRRQIEKSLRRRDVKEWMKHRGLSDEIRRRVLESESCNWVATRGVDEETLMKNLPEELQRDIRRHIFKFLKEVRLFALLDEPSLDAICEKLKQKTYIKEGTILYEGGFVTKMTFIVRGKLESIEKNRNDKVSLSEGDVCGEELLKWCLQDKRSQRKQGNRLRSKRTVKCVTNVEAFVLRAEDLEEVITLFDGFVKNHRLQFAIRKKSPYWQGVAATTIQLAWRYKKKRLNRHACVPGHTTNML